MDHEDNLGEELQDTFFAEALESMERRRTLELAGQRGAAVEMDLAGKGPLWGYVQSRRVQALADLMSLATADPADAVRIAQLQAALKEYLVVCQFIGRTVAEADEAARIIKEDYPHDKQDGDDQNQDD